MPVSAPPTSWANLKNKPSTLSGFGISDAFANGQTWQNVTASRAGAVTYTNSTGKPIMVVTHVSSNPSMAQNLVINGTTMITQNSGGSGYSQQGNIWAVVPDGATYRVDGISGSLNNWWELR